MSKGTKSGNNKAMGGQSNSLLGSVGNGVSKLLGWGGFAPNNARVNNPGVGSWMPLGEPKTGTPTVQQNGIFWGLADLNLVAGSGPQASILMESPRQTLGQGNAPLLQRLSMRILDGQLDLNCIYNSSVPFVPSVPYCVQVGVGIYLAEYNSATGIYQLQDPLGPSDASRFDWIYLESRCIRFFGNSGNVLYATPTQVDMSPKMFDFFNIDVGVDITPGTSLMLVVNALVSAGGANFSGSPTLYYAPQVRGFLARSGA